MFGGRGLRFGVLMLAVYASAALGTAQASTITVTSGNDSGAGTLRDALSSAANGDTINFDSSVTDVVLTSAQLSITTGVTITGPGANVLTIRRSSAGGTPQFRIFSIAPGTGRTASLSGMTISNGDGLPGGGISFAAVGTAQLNLTGVTVSGNNAPWGGGIDGTGSQTGQLTINSSTISGNTTNHGAPSAFTNGAGMKIEVPATIVNSTISGNAAGDNAGGIKVDSNVTILNSTIANNTAPHLGGGIWVTRFSNNPNLKMTNTLVADNTGATGHQCDVDTNNTTLSTNQNNLIEDGSCNFLWASGGVSGSATNFLSGDPNLGSLANNGGTTSTQVLGAGSIARGSGLSTACSTSPVNGVDQRGITRPNPCSIGAYDGAAPTYDLTISKSGTGSGSVTSSAGGISCGSTCIASFSPGATVTLTATAASGSSFSGWSGACSGSATTCNVTMSQANSVTAQFTTSPTTTTTPTADATTEASSPSSSSSTGSPNGDALLATPAALTLSLKSPGTKGNTCVLKTPRRKFFTVPIKLSSSAEVKAVLYYRKRSASLVESCKAGKASGTGGAKLKTARQWNFDAAAGNSKIKIPFKQNGRTLKAGSYTLDLIATHNTSQRSQLEGTKFFIVSR